MPFFSLVATTELCVGEIHEDESFTKMVIVETNQSALREAERRSKEFY
jgi:hypothetical protein